MKAGLKQLLSRFHVRVLREPDGIVMGHDLWRDLDLLLAATPEPLCIDAGANHGEVTAALLRLRPRAHIHAFEPSAKCQTIFRERFQNQSRVTLRSSGLGHEEGMREFHCYANDHLSSFLPLQAGEVNPFQHEPEITRDSVSLTTLDRYAATCGLGSIDLLKIDTQGFDLRVLQGAANLLRADAVRHVLIELNFIPLYQDQAAPEEISSFLRQHGLQLVDYYEKCRRDQRLAWCTALFQKAPR